MATAREVRLRIRSVNNIAQVTRALQTISASRVRRAQQAVQRTRPYATKAWQVLLHLAQTTGRESVHPLLADRPELRRRLVVLITSDRGLAGAYNTNVIRFALEQSRQVEVPTSYVTVGRKGRDILLRRREDIRAEFSALPAEPTYADASAIGQLVIDEFLEGRADQVLLVYTSFVNLLRQIPTMKTLLPLEIEAAGQRVQEMEQHQPRPTASYIYEPGQTELMDLIIARFTQLQLYQALLESQASEHAARMVAMQNATENALDLSGALKLQYNKARQLAITSDMLDIAGGAEALAQARGGR
jgi:F-type H+-transporting ATPase subunit gamma